MTDKTLSWVALLTLMVEGVDRPIRGTIRSLNPETHFAFAGFGNQGPPVLAGSGRDANSASVLRVWRDGERVRIEESDGRLELIADEEQCWQFSAQAVPLLSPRQALQFAGRGTGLLARREAQALLGDDFTRPTGSVGSTSFLGRPAWTVELAPPVHKPHPIQLVVDAETGIVLQQRNDGLGMVDEWTELVVGETFDAALFRWDGPVRSRQDGQVERRRQHEADLVRRRDWFEANVAGLPLLVELELSVLVHEWDEDTGAFQASLGESFLGSLARRPRSDMKWELGWSGNPQRWSDDRWDWAIRLEGGPVSPTGLARLHDQFADREWP